jgi:hypothetical protein
MAAPLRSLSVDDRLRKVFAVDERVNHDAGRYLVDQRADYEMAGEQRSGGRRRRPLRQAVGDDLRRSCPLAELIGTTSGKQCPRASAEATTSGKLCRFLGSFREPIHGGPENMCPASRELCFEGFS